MKNKTDKIYLVLLCIIIAMLNLIIGSNHQEPKTILETIILIIGLTFIAIKKIQGKKNIIIKGKIDIAMLLLVFATFIPLLIKSYYSLNDTINYAIEFLCVYVIYILARNLLKNKKEINIAINVTLISSILIIIFGLDRLYFNVFEKFLDFIGSAKSTAYGMVSTIGYSNPLAAYMSLLSFFALGRYLCIENKWVKALYSSYIQIAMIGFVFGNSRALMVMYPIMFVIYLIVLKDNQKRLQSIAVIGVNILIAFVFEAICNKIVTSNFILWLTFILDLVLVYLLSLIINKIITKIKFKIDKKKVLITIAIIILLLITYCIAVKDIGEPVTIEKEKYIELLGLKNNENYNIKINLDVAINLKENIDFNEKTNINKNLENSNLNIEEEHTKLIISNYTSQRTQEIAKEVILQEGEQNLEFNIQTNQDFERMKVYIVSSQYEDNKATINHIYINNKEYIVKYEYLPNSVIRMLRTLNPRTVSIYERIEFCKDSLKLAKNHLIFGAGGCTFANHIKPYQTYVHGYNKETHSYILDLLLNYGIFGLLIYILILVITILNAYKIIKKAKKEESNNNIALYISILFGILLFTLHAVIDYDLNYLVTLSIYYTTIAILNKEDKKIEQKEKQKTIANILDYAIIIVITAILTLTIPRCYADYLVKQKQYEKAYSLCKYSEELKYKMIGKAYKDKDMVALDEFITLYVKDEKYKRNIYIMDMYRYLSIANLRKGNNDIALKNMEAFYKYVTENDNVSKVNNSEINIKNQVIDQFIKEIEKSKGALDNEQVVNWYNKFLNLKNIDINLTEVIE